MAKKNQTKTEVKTAKPVAEKCPNCVPEKSFWVNDGKVLRNLKELPSALRSMSNDTFLHHVNDQKHDFANWVEHVFGEKQLAEDVRKIKHKAGLAQKVEHFFQNSPK